MIRKSIFYMLTFSILSLPILESPEFWCIKARTFWGNKHSRFHRWYCLLSRKYQSEAIWPFDPGGFHQWLESKFYGCSPITPVHVSGVEKIRESIGGTFQHCRGPNRYELSRLGIRCQGSSRRIDPITRRRMGFTEYQSQFTRVVPDWHTSRWKAPVFRRKARSRCIQTSSEKNRLCWRNCKIGALPSFKGFFMDDRSNSQAWRRNLFGQAALKRFSLR